MSRSYVSLFFLHFLFSQPLKHSEVAKAHPDWVLKRDGSNEAANSGNCGKWFYGLDLTKPAVQRHVRDCLEVALNIWGFSYLKLDFLYSAALAGCQDSLHDRTLTKAQVMQLGMGIVSEMAGDSVFVLGCGAPLGSAIGHVHANRISSDAGFSWFPDFPLPQDDTWNLPSARTMLKNTLARLFMHGEWWINDPDCLLLRDKLRFTPDELVGICTTKVFSGGSVIISDDLNFVSAKRLRMFSQMVPPSNVAAVALDLLDREIPEVLRLSLAHESLATCNKGVYNTAAQREVADALASVGMLESGGKGAGGVGTAAVLLSGRPLVDHWTLLAVCNWGAFVST